MHWDSTEGDEPERETSLRERETSRGALRASAGAAPRLQRGGERERETLPLSCRGLAGLCQLPRPDAEGAAACRPPTTRCLPPPPWRLPRKLPRPDAEGVGAAFRASLRCLAPSAPLRPLNRLEMAT
jgi:hypothetical protein